MPAERPQSRVLSLSAATLALYAATWWIERAIFRNGIVPWHSIVDPGEPGNRALLAGELLAYALVTLGIFACYLELLRLCRDGGLASPRARLLALGTPVLIAVMLGAMVPRLSQDLFSYLAQGYLGVLPGDNPLLQPAEAVRGTLTGARLDAFGWHVAPGISPYGILWTRIEVAVAAAGGRHIFTGIALLKSIAVAATLASAGMIWVILGHIRPALQWQGTLAYLWNPLVLMELAGEGHNDALMIFFTLAALAACVRARPTSSLILQGLGALTKYVPLLLLPAQLVYLWRQRRSGARISGQILLAALVLGALAVLLYARYWVGLHSFHGLVRRDIPNGLASLFGAVGVLLRRTPLKPISAPLRLLLLTVPALIFILWQSLRVRDALQLARVFAWSSLAFVLVASPDFWPWYACLPIALICAGELDRLLWLAVLMSLMGRLFAPMELLHDHGYLGLKVSKALITGFGSLLPLLALLGWWLCGRYRAVQSRSHHPTRHAMQDHCLALPPAEAAGINGDLHRS